MTTTNITDIELYGEYNWQDPIYKVVRRETASPRYKIYLMKKGLLSTIFYQYTDFLALHPRSGEDLDKIFRRQRQLLVDENITTQENDTMKAFFEETNSPYEDVEETDYNYGPVWCG